MYWSVKEFNPAEFTINRIGSRRKFGVELEYNDIPNRAEIKRNVVFGLKDDPSVRAGEFYSPILYGDQGITECEKLCSYAGEFECGNNAGYHLHLNMRDESVEGLKRIALAYHYTKAFWLGAIPSARREYTYTKSHTWQRRDILAWKNSRDHMDFCDVQDRYVWTNWYAYGQHNTLEIRCHETVKDAPSVINWVIAHTRFCDAMSDTKVGRITRIFGNKKPGEIFREIRAILREPVVSEHLNNRYKEFNHGVAA